MLEANKEVVRSYFELVSQGRIDEYMDLLADDFVLRGMGMPASGITHRMGKKELHANATAYERKFAERIVITIDNIIAEGCFVAIQARSKAKLGDGRSYGNRYSFFVRLEGGKIKEMDEYCCTFTVLKDLRDFGVGS